MFVYIYTVTILKHFKHLTTNSWTGALGCSMEEQSIRQIWGGVFIQMLTCINPDINNYFPLFQCRRIINEHITINIVLQN